MAWKSDRKIGPFTYALLYGVATLILYQGPLLGYVLGQMDPFSAEGLAILWLIQILPLTLTVFLMTLMGLIWPLAMKIVCAVLFVANATASYFMANYGTMMSKDVVLNILDFHGETVLGLMHPALFLNIFLFGVIPAVLALIVPVDRGRLFRQAGGLIGIAIVSVASVWAASSVWLWFDEHNSQIGPRILPWGYIGNALRVNADNRALNARAIPLPDPSLRPLPAERTIVVLVIGEAARRDHLGQYGYPRDTAPFTRGLGVRALNDGMSCTTFTYGSVDCIFAAEGAEMRSNAATEPLPDYVLRAGIPVLYRSNDGLPRRSRVPVEVATSIAESCLDPECPDPYHDGILLHGLDAQLAAMGERELVILHLHGSHGPDYYRRYPPEFEAFSPVCESVSLSDCTPENLVNAYDNSIRYTDYLLAEVIGMLDALPDTQALLLYVSDHGQSLGENGVYLHGLPNAIAPDVQRIIPYLVWMDEDFIAGRGIDTARLPTSVAAPQDTIFHTVLGALGIDSPAYQASHDLFQRNQEGREP